MAGRVVHFEVPFDDAERATAFYGDVFGWQIMAMPEFDYHGVSTGPVGDQGMPAEPGYIGGGMFKRQDGGPSMPHTVRAWAPHTSSRPLPGSARTAGATTRPRACGTLSEKSGRISGAPSGISPSPMPGPT